MEKVYFTKDLTSEGLIKVFDAAGGEGFLYSGNDDVENHEVDGLHFLLK